MDINYKKTDNQKLFKSLEENSAFGILQPQNYIPIYNTFFELSPTNYNTIILNNKWKLNTLTAQETNNIFKGTVKAEKGEKGESIKETRPIYLKYSPLLDPIKYLMGRYDTENPLLLNLPQYNDSTAHSKVLDTNNAAYVDSFFTYLASKLLHEHGFLHGLDFYGSFLAHKSDFQFNVIDDIEYMSDSSFFKKNNTILYEFDENAFTDAEGDTRNYKKKLKFTDVPDKNILNLSDIEDLTQLDYIMVEKEPRDADLMVVDITNTLNNDNNDNNANETTPVTNIKKNTGQSNTCSSRSSDTSVGDIEMTDDNQDPDADPDPDAATHSESGSDGSDGSEDEDDEEDDEDEDDEEETLFVKIKKFPVQVIALEHCESTLDRLMSHGELLTEAEWGSIVIQLLFSLITFQNTFGLTHNDLHTNNVMYVKTEKKFLYYKINHIYYKVPTFGKLFKIIDFGRAIYKFRGQTLCSDSYHKEGDAATQYNCEPYFNTNKPRLEPNFSFDLCRLGCALYDYMMDEPETAISKIIIDWCKDDKGRNILYKKNGDERYPEFKLYKMIARTVHKHIPVEVLANAYFNQYIVGKKEIAKAKAVVMDLDAIPVYM